MITAGLMHSKQPSDSKGPIKRKSGTKQPIRLRCLSGDLKGRYWEHDKILRAGREGKLEIVLDDASVSRRHAEVRHNVNGWWVRDFQSTNGTYVNGVRLGTRDRQLHSRDIVQFGKVAMLVEFIEDPEKTAGDALGSDKILIEKSTRSSWEGSVVHLAFDRNHRPRAGDQLLALLRAGHNLVTTDNEEDLLQSILNDAVSVLDAQRGAIVLADGVDSQLRLRALASGKGESQGRFAYSKKLAQRCYQQEESILCSSVEDDLELKGAGSIAGGAMASVLCVLLRTPRKCLGVLHLDRNCWKKGFTEDDLHLADALAAHVSAGIEVALLLRKQRDLFLNTITILAQAVEMRDEYTGGHTARVTNYSMLLAEQMRLPSKELELIRIGTPLHDIGKIGIDDNILRKPGKLTEAEFEIMKTHTVKVL